MLHDAGRGTTGLKLGGHEIHCRRNVSEKPVVAPAEIV